ncbi:MAG: thioredoxin family protein [Planctomycetota bacterium]
MNRWLRGVWAGAVLVAMASSAWGQGLLGGGPLGAEDRPPVTVSAASREAAVEPGGRAVLGVVLDMSGKWHVWPDAGQARPVEGLFQIHTTATLAGVLGPDGEPVEGLIETGAWQYPPPHEVEAFGQSILAWDGVTVLMLPVEVAAGVEPGLYRVVFEVGYQACDDQVCLRPEVLEVETELRVMAPGETADEAQGVAPVSLFEGFDDAGWETIGTADAGDTAGSSIEAVPGGSMTWRAFATAMGLAVVGGVLLNVMPCVLPVIPIKILGLAQAAPDPRRRVLLGAVMAGGVVAFWLAVGGVVAGLSAAISAAFGYWWFNVGLGAVIVGLAVAMCGVWAPRLPQWVYAINPKHDSVSGAAGFGVMTGVLATPCTGPILGGVAGGVIQEGPAMVMAVFAAIGVGMALPYFVLSVSPGLIERLPRTGPASELLKQVMAMLMAAAGAFFLGVGLNALRHDGTGPVYQWFWWLAAGVIAAAGLWLAVRTVQITPQLGRRLAFGGLGLAMAAGSLGLAYDVTRPSPIAWVYYSPEKFDEALADGRAVMLDFTADWCLNCIALEKAVLESQEVVSRLDLPDVVPMKADLTSHQAAGWDKLAAVDRLAIPLLVVFAPDGREVFKAEFYTPAQVVEAIDRATESPAAQATARSARLDGR